MKVNRSILFILCYSLKRTIKTIKNSAIQYNNIIFGIYLNIINYYSYIKKKRIYMTKL